MAGMNGCHTKTSDPSDQFLLRVIGINGSQFWLDWFASIELILIMVLIEHPG